MLQNLFSVLGRVFSFILSLVFTMIISVVTWGFWQYYQDVLVQKKFVEEGHLIPVTIDQASQKQQSWRDIFSNSTYLTFQHRGKTYTTRFVMDSSYVGSGDRVTLLYHTDLDAFRQPRDVIRYDQSSRKSRLVDWTSIRSFTDEHKLLFSCLLLTLVTFFLISGVIATILPLSFLQEIARLVLTVAFILAAVFFTYDTYQYFNYYQHLKTNGHEVVVRVLDTGRRAVGNNTSSSVWKTYTYEATIQYQQQKRIIPISGDDYEALKPKDSLKAYYDESIRDFMSVDYGPDYWRVFVPIFFWLLAMMSIRSVFVRKRTKQPTAVVK